MEHLASCRHCLFRKSVIFVCGTVDPPLSFFFSGGGETRENKPPWGGSFSPLDRPRAGFRRIRVIVRCFCVVITRYCNPSSQGDVCRHPSRLRVSLGFSCFVSLILSRQFGKHPLRIQVSCHKDPNSNQQNFWAGLEGSYAEHDGSSLDPLQAPELKNVVLRLVS